MSKNTTKIAVVSYLKHDRTLIEARNLYSKLPNKNLATNAYLSRMPDTAESVRIACYELCKLVGVPERQMNALLSKPVKKKVEKKQLVVPINSTGDQDNDNDNADDEDENLENSEEQKTITDKAPPVEDTTDVTPKKPTLKLRDQFPFLNEKECPKVLHLITAEMMRAYNELLEKQPKLHEKGTEQEQKQTVEDVLSSYINRKQAYAELEYYKENQALLGEHPIFKEIEEQNEILKMDGLTLNKKVGSLTNRLNRNKKKFKEAKETEGRLKSQYLIDRDEKLMLLVESELKNR